MSEEVLTLSVGHEHINGILHIPEYQLNQKIVVVFLHGWAGYRTGPHDMFVKLARKLTHDGYYCLRFDFRGRGFSHGNKNATSNKTMLVDIEVALDYIEKQIAITHVVLLGICSGAKLALYYAKSGTRPVDHVIELSSPVLRYDEVMQKVQIARTKANLIEYFFKLFRKEVWLKLFSGEVHFVRILTNTFKPLLKLKFAIKRKNNNNTVVSNAQRNIQNKSFSKFKGNILLIHGEKDPETELSVAQISELLQQHKIGYETHLIKGANHSFYSLKWEQEIFDIITCWLNKQFEKVLST
jgi:hypothetical protein